MASAKDPFTLIDYLEPGDSGDGPQRLFDTYTDIFSAKLADPFTQLLTKLRNDYPDYVVTFANPGNLNLLAFAAAGFATAALDTDTDSLLRVRYWVQPAQRGSVGNLGDVTTFAKYHYRWGNEDYILYTVVVGISAAQYILKERAADEGQLSHSAASDALFSEVGRWQYKERKGIYVFDQRWYLDANLYDQVQKATWDRVILNPDMKKELTSVSSRFFDNKDVYEDLGVPWKRGLIFYGPAGNGKTVSIKALMHTLAQREKPIPTLYVKSAPQTYHIRSVFSLARSMSPCLLVLEDIDTIVTSRTRSYFFNEVDGLENNDGILMVASTNHIDQLDPGLSKRPSRFDRKYLFPEPDQAERIEYVRYWRQKLSPKKDVEFPDKLVVPIADITHDFSFAYMQEAFVATLLEMAHHRDDTDTEESGPVDSEDNEDGDDDDDLDDYELWRTMKQQVKTLRDEVDSKMAEPANESSLPALEPEEIYRALKCIVDIPEMHESLAARLPDRTKSRNNIWQSSEPTVPSVNASDIPLLGSQLSQTNGDMALL